MTVEVSDLPAVPTSIAAAGAAIRAGELTSRALVEACLARADVLDPLLGVYIQRLDETALSAASAADAEMAAGIDRGPLHGIPIGIKDIIATEESTTTAQSLILDRDWGTVGDAPVVARLRNAGAIMIGKTSTMEFAIGMPDASKPFPVPRNPWDTDRWTGGSSSGTGAGIAAGLFLAGLGTDTGGSVRIPAAFCGISGLKQTFGLVPKSGCVPLGYSLDHIGPMARSAADCLALISVMAGYDPSDATSVDIDPPQWPQTLGLDLSGMTLGVERVNHLGHPLLDPSTVEVFETALGVLETAGATLVDFEIPHYELMRSAGTVTSRAEASSYHRVDLSQRWTEYGIHTSKATSMGTVLSGADYVQAQRVRSFCNAALSEAMSSVDAVVTPMAGIGAPLVEGLDHTSFMDWPVFSQYWNPTGLPALAIPMGLSSSAMPLSLQLAGAPFTEPQLLTIANAYQAATDWHLQLPPLAAGAAV